MATQVRNKRTTGNRWLESFVPYLLYRITNNLDRRLRAHLRDLDINVVRWRILSVVKAYGTLNMSEIVATIGMEQPTVSRVIDQLEREKLVARRIARRDSRFVYVDLTPSGAAAFEAILPIARRHQERALRGFTKAEISTLKGFLVRIQSNLDAVD